MAEIDPLAKISRLFHFTDTRNLDSIREYDGLLPMAALRKVGVEVIAAGGNDWSLDADKRFGLDQYVHLCFRREHPMEFRARESGRISNSIFLEISPEILSFPGVMFTKEVSNKSGANRYTMDQAKHLIDFEVLYTRTDWSDPNIRLRLNEATKCEILVPRRIPISLIRNFPNG